MKSSAPSSPWNYETPSAWHKCLEAWCLWHATVKATRSCKKKKRYNLVIKNIKSSDTTVLSVHSSAIHLWYDDTNVSINILAFLIVKKVVLIRKQVWKEVCVTGLKYKHLNTLIHKLTRKKQNNRPLFLPVQFSCNYRSERNKNIQLLKLESSKLGRKVT